MFSPPAFIDLPTSLTTREIDQFLREQRAEELIQKLRTNNMEIFEFKGGRNLQKIRMRMQRELSVLVRWLLKNLPGYEPPKDWIPTRAQKWLSLPVDPHINFISLIVGPGGTNHVRLQNESKCMIVLGKGSDESDDESDHRSKFIYIEGDDEEDIEKAEILLQPYIDPTHPDSQIKAISN